MIVKVLESFLGNHKKHNEDKGQASWDCPACAADKMLEGGDGKGKLEVNYKKGVFKCWVCAYKNNMHGPIEKLIKRYGTKVNLRDYLLLKPETPYEKESYEDKIVKASLPQEFIPLKSCSKLSPKCFIATKYLSDRGIAQDIIEKYNIGYAHEGLYKNRIIIPSYDEYGDINYFIARSFNKWTKPKYLNPDVEKEYIIFNQYKINFDATIYLLEGVFDHLVTPNSIPLLGKTLSHKLKQTLIEKAKANIIILLDNDAYDDAVKLYKELDFGDLSGRVKLCKPPVGYDPSLIYQMIGKKGIVKLLKSAKELNYEELV
jgi:DNA primase